MDPLTQGLLGGVVVEASLSRGLNRPLVWAGVLGGAAPDLDILIRSATDPLLFLEFHRHFTHSLLFIPLGSLVVALILYIFFRKCCSFPKLYLATTLGYATHGLLDAMTGYGTLLFWPFSLERVAWNWIFVLDIFFTTLLIFGFLFSYPQRGPRAARVALLLGAIYLCFGIWNHHRAGEFQEQLAKSRGHVIQHAQLQPTLSNSLLWRSLYQSGDQIVVDAIRVSPWGPSVYWDGGSLPVFKESLLPKLAPDNTPLQEDLALFAWFSGGFWTLISSDPWVVGDLRFASIPNGLSPLWGIHFVPLKPEQRAKRINFPRKFKRAWDQYWQMLWLDKPQAKSLGPG